MEPSDALSVSLAYSIFCLLGRAARLAKDIVWLAADSKFGEYASVAEWLKQYHDPVFIRKKLNFHPVDGDILFLRGISEDFKRAGTMAAAIVFKVLETSQGTGTDNVNICAESSNGQMPNLDLINIVHYLAVHRHGLHVEVGKLSFLLNSLWLKVVGKFLEGVSNIAGGLNPKWRFALPVLDYVEGIAVLASSVYHQALGVPTVPHGAFRDYQIDAITLEISPRVSLNSEIACSSFLVRVGRLCWPWCSLH